MKKLAITLSTATLLLGSLLGCGAADQDNGVGGLNTTDQRGMGYHATDGDNGYTGERAGEGPITDLFTDDDRRGARGLGRENRRPATGLVGPKNTPHQFGMTRQDLNGRTRTGGAIRGTGNNLGITEQGDSYGTNGQNRGMRGTGFGNRQTHGIRGTEFGNRQNHGMKGANTGFGTDVNDKRNTGIVGNREGYVDDRGILRGEGTRDHDRIGGLGQTGRTNMGRNGGQARGIGQFEPYDRAYDNLPEQPIRNNTYRNR